MEGLPYNSFSCMIKVCRLYSVHIAHEVTGESNSIQFQICLSCIAIQIEMLPEMGLGLDSSQGLRCNRAGCNTNLPSLGSRTGWATYCRFLDSWFMLANTINLEPISKSTLQIFIIFAQLPKSALLESTHVAFVSIFCKLSAFVCQSHLLKWS